MSTYRRVFVGLSAGGGFAALLLSAAFVPAAAQTTDGRTYDNEISDLGLENEDIDPADAADQARDAKARRPERPQDPLDKQYEAAYGRHIDQKDHAGLYRPLDEPYYSFRPGPAVLPEEEWRTRDDGALEPLGIRGGSLIFYPEVGSHLLATDNIFAAHDNRESDYAAVITPSLKVNSDWNRHEMELFFTGEQRFWDSFKSENTGKFETRARGRLDITSRTSVEAGTRYARGVDGRGSTGLPGSAKAPGVTHTSETYLQGNHKLNRLGFRLRGAFERDLYEDVELNSGAILDNGGRNNDNSKLEFRTSYEFSPRLEVFADWDNNWRRFHNDLDSSGLKKDHRGWLAALGAKVEVTPTVNVTGRLGYAQSRPEEETFSTIEGVVADASLVWQPTSLVTATLATRTEINESSDSGVNGSLDRTYSFELKNDWSYRFRTALIAARTIKQFVDGPVTETDTSYAVKADYTLNRNAVVDASYQHTFNEAATSYYENEVRIGLKLRD